MPTIDAALRTIARNRARDPLAPVTVIAPSHVAALQLRRRLASEHGAFAGVRFETLGRLAELLGAASLAKQGRKPLARPIGDYVASQVARESMGPLAGVQELPGYGRVLRQTFQRLRRGGFRTASEVPVDIESGRLGEVVRLYGLYRARTSGFYDDEDLLDAAADALEQGSTGFADELGEVWLAPPGPLSAGADRLVRAINRRTPIKRIDETPPAPGASASLILAPDPASEAREAARAVIAAVEGGCPISEVAIFYGSDRTYRLLLSEALAAADLPAVVLPGRPLIETPAGRGVLALAELPISDYSRTETFDFLNLTPLRSQLPAGGATVAPLASAWQRLARDAGVTHGLERWQGGLEALIEDREAALATNEELTEARRGAYEVEVGRAATLRDFIATLIARLDPLLMPQPAAGFIDAFKAVVRDYLQTEAEGLTEVVAEIDQLGTVDAVGGRFSLASFAESLRANLTTASRREGGLGDGVLVAGYQIAAGLHFRHVILCGAYEGVFPGGAPVEPLVSDETWARLREKHPFVEDARLRLQRGLDAARRATSTASQSLTWTAPLRDSSGSSDRYPSALMLVAARDQDAGIETASTLRTAPASAWLSRAPSPLASRLRSGVIDLSELRLRQTLGFREQGGVIGPHHQLFTPLTLLRARRGRRFSEFDGNLRDLEGRELLLPRATASPTSLESYATCGMRYFLSNVLRLRAVKEPEERDTIDPAERGSIVHAALEAFFREQQALGRPGQGEAWTEGDVERLLAIVDERLVRARRRGLTGLDVYAGFDSRTIRADLAAFLSADSAFRAETGAVPYAFEQRIPATQVGDVAISGFVDRVDRTPDGRLAWVIDYKTGSASAFEKMKKAEDPFAGGLKLQLPVYVFAAAEAQHVTALYWFITRRGGFERIEYTTSTENLDRFVETIGTINDGLRAGSFPAISGVEDEFRGGFENCLWCDFDRVCSLRRNYEHLDKQTDPDFVAWLRVGQVARGEAEP